jgi:hypothetical protein
MRKQKQGREGSVNLHKSPEFFLFFLYNKQQLTEPANVNIDSFFRVKYYITQIYILNWHFKIISKFTEFNEQRNI